VNHQPIYRLFDQQFILRFQHPLHTQYFTPILGIHNSTFFETMTNHSGNALQVLHILAECWNSFLYVLSNFDFLDCMVPYKHFTGKLFFIDVTVRLYIILIIFTFKDRSIEAIVNDEVIIDSTTKN
jgi:hypothetical protein